jgi:signal transduction histidine kinase
VEAQFTASSFTPPSKVTFATRLTRDGQEVIQTESDRCAAVFDWLPPGTYNLRVSAANHHGTWNMYGVGFSFAMLPFFWQTLQFWMFIAVALVALTAGVVWRTLHNKHRRLEERLAERTRAEEILSQEHELRLQAERAARDASQRLLAAHEVERSRVARELHDDVTQRLARLAIDAAQTERGLPMTSDNGASRSMREELARLSEDVHTLAYRLHPLVLDELGLVEAIRAECDRLSRRESIRAVLKSRDVPHEISRDVGLCLLRITQESLRNVARHAHAQSVEVSLTAMDGGLQLAVCDDGIGFNPVQDRGRPSLGHESMKERINLVEGELDIESAPGHGTTIVAWVPLNLAFKS